MQEILLPLCQEDIAEIDLMAASLETDRITVLQNAVERYIAAYRREFADAEQADREYDRGETLPHSHVKDLIDSWSKTGDRKEAA